MNAEELARQLGLGANELQLSDRQTLSRDVSARGDVAESLDHVVERLEREGDVVDVLPAAGTVIQHLQWALGTYFVSPGTESERIEVVAGRFRELGAGELLVSGREGPAVVRVRLAGKAGRVYVLGHGSAELWAIATSTVASPAPLPATPRLASMTGGLSGSSDIEAEFTQLSESAVALDRLAAVGLMLRFWVPVDREIRRQRLLALAQEDSPLLIATRQWYSAFEEPARSAARADAVRESRLIGASFAQLEAVEDEGVARVNATELALRRDRLESVRRVFQAVGDVDELREALRALDSAAAIHLTRLASAGIVEERLRRVLASEPDAWWAIISG